MTDICTREAAAILGISAGGFRREMQLLREKKGLDFRRPGPDARTVFWDEEAIRAWIPTRPGKGNWDRAKKKAEREAAAEETTL